mmetsp:Transcript_45863/g.127648  ORF Transcript_45863/g.127648 Transcript_45863/m.127648 type:complete len:374 (-) Transcript_45863:96-1217(-)
MTCCLEFLPKLRTLQHAALDGPAKGPAIPTPLASVDLTSTCAHSLASEDLLTTCTSEVDRRGHDGGTAARAKFLRDDVSFGEGRFGPQPGSGRLGYNMPNDLLEPRNVQLLPFPCNAELSEQGAELLDVKDALARVGVTEASFDPENKEHRRLVGEVLMQAAEARFPGMMAVHLADTSRVSGSAVYGEATIRSTGSSRLRAAQHVFHLDKFLPGIAKLYGGSGARFGAQLVVGAYWPFWEPDFSRLGVGREEAVDCTLAACPGMLNLWVSMTPGEIRQNPLAVADMRNILLDDGDLDCVSTHAIVFPGLEDTITVLRPRATEVARLLYRPRMRFGEVIMFSTTHTPHSAVWLEGTPDVPRCSAEIRLLLVPRR